MYQVRLLILHVGEASFSSSLYQIHYPCFLWPSADFYSSLLVRTISLPLLVHFLIHSWLLYLPLTAISRKQAPQLTLAFRVGIESRALSLFLSTHIF